MTTTFEDVVAHRDAMLDVFSEITQDCVLLGLAPIHVSVNRWSNGSLDVSVQFSGTDTVAVDAFAASYGLPPALPQFGNYTREGRLDIVGRQVEVRAYTGRPKLPAHPAGYAPQAVETEPCPECHGSGQADQQPDGLIIECPRGCMTDDGRPDGSELIVARGQFDPMAAQDNQVMCEEQEPDGRKVCTRREGHDGQHVACGVGDLALSVWS